MTSERIIVSGGAGFLGKYVCEALQQEGYEVVVIDKKLNPNHDLVFADIDKIIEEHNPDGWIILNSLVGLKHCYDNPENAVYQNVTAITRILKSCKDYCIKKVIYASTWAVKGNLANPYDLTKLAAENMVNSYCQLHGLPTIILRLGTLYGPGMSEIGVIPSFIKNVVNKKPLIVYGRGEQIRQFTWCKDAANAFVKALQRGTEGETYYVVSPEVTTIRQIAELVLEGKEDLEHFLKYVDARQYDEKYEPIDSSRTIQELGWVPRISIKKGIQLMKETQKNG